MQLKLKIKKFNKYRDKTGGLIPFYLKKHFEKLRISNIFIFKERYKRNIKIISLFISDKIVKKKKIFYLTNFYNLEG